LMTMLDAEGEKKRLLRGARRRREALVAERKVERSVEEVDMVWGAGWAVNQLARRGRSR
jgi:hypothetical protein